MALMQVCCAAGCDELALPGLPRCADHEAARQANAKVHRAKAKLSADALRGSALYADPAWKRAAKAWLRAHPLCVDCEELGLVVVATEVDHRQPHRGDRALFWARGNWQGLCKPCHSRKTMREVNARRGGGGQKTEAARSKPRP